MEEHQLHSLIVRYLSKETTDEEESELLDWVAKDPSNQHVFKEWQQAWNHSPLPQPAFNFHQGIERLNKSIEDSEAKLSRHNWRNIAASVVVFLVAGFAIYFMAGNSWRQSQLIAFKEFTTVPGEIKKFILVDGSTITLNGNTTFKYPEEFSNNKREVFLSGEAFFEIAKDSKRPFIIHSGELETQVIGTSFNINSKKNLVTVSVASGKVKVTNGKVNSVLLPNEKAVYHTQGEQFIKSTSNLEDELAWKDNAILFEDSPLLQAAVKLEEFYGYAVVFENENIKKCSVTGKFKRQPIETVLRAISFSTGIQYKITGKSVILFGDGCE